MDERAFRHLYFYTIHSTTTTTATHQNSSPRTTVLEHQQLWPTDTACPWVEYSGVSKGVHGGAENPHWSFEQPHRTKWY